MAVKKYNAVAKQQIKYGGVFLKNGEKFKVLEKDLDELKNFAEIDIPEEEEINQEPGKEGENGGE